jgi:sugar lactone lactonase YvrE
VETVFKSVNGTISLIAGNSRPGFSGDGGPAVNAQLNAPTGVAVDKNGNVYISDSLNNRVRLVNAKGIISTFAGSGGIGQPTNFGDGGPAVQAYIHLPGGLALDSSGDLFIADTGDNTVRKVTPDGNIAAFAGNGLPSYTGDAGPAVTAELHSPEDVAVDSSGNVYIADTGNAYIRKVTTDGNINFIAGDGSIGYFGDNGLATSAGLIEPYGLAIDAAGNIYIAERADGRIRQINTKGNIYTIVGNGSLGISGDGGSPTSAMLNLPTSVAIDASGNLYIADSLNNRVRLVTKSGTGNISTVAGNGNFSYSGDGFAATAAQLYAPQAVAVDGKGNFYIADAGNNVVREVFANGIINTFAGNGSGGDNSPASSAQLFSPQGVAVDAAGNVYISDTGKSAPARRAMRAMATPPAAPN